MRFKFKIEDVRARLAHSKSAKEWSKLYGIDGTDQPGLWLVKDRGVYIMSNANPKELVNPGDPDNSRCVVSYAEGHDPKKDEDWWVGGDDYVEIFSAEDLEPELTENVTHVIFEVSDSTIKIVLEERKPKRRKSSKATA